MTNAPSTTVSVRYMIDDVNAAVAFYTNYFGFTLDVDSAPAFAAVTRGNLRLLLAYMYASPGKKLLFMGTELAPWEEWRHDDALPWHLDDPQRRALSRCAESIDVETI